MTKYKQYEISSKTIRDIMEKIPQEKWPFVIRDLEAMLNQTAATLSTVGALSNLLGLGAKTSEIVQMKETIVWVDDGKCENKIEFTDHSDQKIGSIKFGDK